MRTVSVWILVKMKEETSLLTAVEDSISDILCLFLTGKAIWVSSNESDERVWWFGLLIGGRINSLDLS